MKIPSFYLYPIVLCFVCGMIAATYTILDSSLSLKTSLLITGVLSIGVFWKRSRHKHYFLFLLFLPIGYFFQSQYDRIPKNHYSYFTSEQGTHSFSIRLTRALKKNVHNERFYGEIIRVDKIKTVGKVLISIEKDSLKSLTKNGTFILTSIPPKKLKRVLNPGGFDYANYLKRIRIYDQINLKKGEYKTFSSHAEKSKNWSTILKTKVNQKIDESKLNFASKNIIKTLLLGDRDVLEKDMTEAYSNAGVIHILAISGLHIGIIMLFLNFILTPVRAIPKGRIIQAVLVVSLLWAFAFFTGGSASVIRAVTMFSAFSIAKYSKRITNSFHLLVVSFFMLLIAYPPFLFQLGFQMSYLAVFGILWIHPILQKLWKPKFWLFKRFWQLTTVSVAAQFAVAPLSIYTFHQFPGLFLISNWIILPLFGVFLIGSIFVLLLLMINSLPEVIALIYDSIVTIMNESIYWIARKEKFIFENITFSGILLVMSYTLILLFFLWVKNRRQKDIIHLLYGLLALQTIILIQNYNTSKINDFWVFYKYRETVIAHHHQTNLDLYTRDPISIKTGLIADFSNENNLKKINFKEFKNTFIKDEFRLLIVDENGVCDVPEVNPSHLMLVNNPKIHLDRILERQKLKAVIVDASNGPWNIELWEKSCKKYNVKLIDIHKDGAYKISL